MVAPKRVQPAANFPYADVTGTAAIRRPVHKLREAEVGAEMARAREPLNKLLMRLAERRFPPP